MKCPICPNTDLVMTERQGIEIDYCPNCRGIWLDRGELDKMIDKALSNEKGSPYFQQHEQGYRNQSHSNNSDYHKYTKKHWLSELFD